MQTDGQSRSIWMDIGDVPEYKRLAEDTQTDVCIVGAGIAGLTTAYLLAREGVRVVVLEGRGISFGETGRSTAQLSNAVDDRYYEMEKLHGVDGARIIAESLTRAIDELERIVQEEKIDCDFERIDGYLFLPPDEGSPENLDRELEAAHRAGLTDVEKVSRAPLKDFDTGPALRFPRQGQFDPVRYLAGLARAITRDGGRIHANTRVSNITSDSGNKGTVRVETEGGASLTAKHVVVATNSPVNDRVTMHTKQAPYRTYVVGMRVPRGSVQKALYWDTLDPYHYVRLQAMPNETAARESDKSGSGRQSNDVYDVVITGGADHKTGQEDDADRRYQELEQWTRDRFPMVEKTVYRWSGQVMESMDGVAFIGRNPGEKNVYIVTGDSGQGTSHGTIAGILLTDLIQGRVHHWEKLYDPARKNLSASALSEFIVEQVNVAQQYADLVTGGDVSSVDEVAPGTGAIMRRGLSKVAVYRDESGTLHERSAVCTHLGCIVQWNSGEKSWDCPCHGSRFDAQGRVIEGPAKSDLAGVEI